MPTLIITDQDGQTRTIQAEPGRSVMEVIRDHDFDGLMAICGGACSCATCHVWVDLTQMALLPPLGPDEEDLLDSLDQRRPGSRLSCQISVTREMDGLRVTIAPSD